MSFLRFVPALLTIALVSGCVSIPPPEASAPVVQFTTSKSVATAVIDNRSYVLNKEKDAYYEGYYRDLWGIPHSMPTQGKQPMSVLVGARINVGLSKQNIKVNPLTEVVSFAINDSAAIKSLAEKGNSDKLLLVVLNDWMVSRKSVTYNLSFIYDVDVHVFDKQGKLIDRKNFKGVDDRDGSLLDMYEEDLDCFKAGLEKMINDASVSKALQS